MKRSIKLNWFYPYSAEVIWDCLTDPEKLKQWNNINKTGTFKPEIGFKWTETSKPRKGWDGKMYFEVLEIVPLKKISYSFRGGPNPGQMTLDTVVTWILVPRENGTELHLHHTGFEGIKGMMTSFIMEKGWNKHFAQKLLKYLKESAYEPIQL